MTTDAFPSRSRLVTGALLLATIAAGLASRRYPAWQPVFAARYAGDTLWASMVYWSLALVRPRGRTHVLGAAALGIAVADELSQLYKAPWIDHLRATSVGALALGHGFLWSDLWCYAAGVALAAAVDLGIRRRGRGPGAI